MQCQRDLVVLRVMFWCHRALWAYIFRCFGPPTFWAYGFRRFGASDALARRLCSESLPGYVPLTMVRMTHAVCAIKNALVS